MVKISTAERTSVRISARAMDSFILVEIEVGIPAVSNSTGYFVAHGA